MYRTSLGTRGETRRAAAEAETAVVGRVRRWRRETRPSPLAPHVVVPQWVRGERPVAPASPVKRGSAHLSPTPPAPVEAGNVGNDANIQQIVNEAQHGMETTQEEAQHVAAEAPQDAHMLDSAIELAEDTLAGAIDANNLEQREELQDDPPDIVAIGAEDGLLGETVAEDKINC